MSDLGRKMAKGAAWMVLFKLIERSLGLVTTLVLARLLVPADFGIVAMATSVIAVLDILTGFSFDIALIQKQDAEQRHYHSAWTLNFLTYSAMALLMVLLAAPMAAYYRELRVESVLYALAFGIFVVGFENIGTVAFRKELMLSKEFRFLLAKKLVAAVVSISVAVAFRSYWALVAGMVTSRVVGVLLSYVVHPFRPRPSLDGARELMQFSKGLFLNFLVAGLTSRVPDFVIGRVVGPAGLGTYSIGFELSNLPTTELVMPIHRAIFPGYARMVDDRPALRTGFLTVLSLAALLVVPAAAGIAVVAEPLVQVLLGAKWVAVIPVIQVLALYGLLTAFQTNAWHLFVASGHIGTSIRIGVIQIVLLVPALLLGVYWNGVVGAAWGALATSALLLPVVYIAVYRLLRPRHRDYVAALWRPVVAAGLMLGTVHAWMRWFGTTALGESSLLTLLGAVGIGAIVYAGAVLLLWWISGRPAGAESQALQVVRAKLRRA